MVGRKLFWAQISLALLVAISGPKKVAISGPVPSNVSRNGYRPHQNHYVPRHIKNRYINSYYILLLISKLCCTKGCFLRAHPLPTHCCYSCVGHPSHLSTDRVEEFYKSYRLIPLMTPHFNGLTLSLTKSLVLRFFYYYFPSPG